MPYKLKNGKNARVWSCPRCYIDIYEGFDWGFENGHENNICPHCDNGKERNMAGKCAAGE